MQRVGHCSGLRTARSSGQGQDTCPRQLGRAGPGGPPFQNLVGLAGTKTVLVLNVNTMYTVYLNNVKLQIIDAKRSNLICIPLVLQPPAVSWAAVFCPLAVSIHVGTFVF